MLSFVQHEPLTDDMTVSLFRRRRADQRSGTADDTAAIEAASIKKLHVSPLNLQKVSFWFANLESF